MKNFIKLTAVFQKILMHLIWMIFNKTTQTCEKSAIKFDEKENIQDIFNNQFHFSFQKIHRNENRFLRTLKVSNVDTFNSF